VTNNDLLKRNKIINYIEIKNEKLEKELLFKTIPITV